VKRVLVINTSRMGDLIQSTPLLQGLRDDGWEVTLLYSDGFQAVAPLLPGPHRLIPLRLSQIVSPLIDPRGRLAASLGELNALVGLLQSLKFDLTINVTHSRYSAFLTRLAGAKETLGLSFDVRGNRQVRGAWANYYFNSALNRNFNRFNLVDLNRLIGGVTRPYPVKLNLPEAVRDNLHPRWKLSSDSRVRWVGVVPGASTREKCWPVEAFAGAITEARRQVEFRTVILGASSEVETAARLNKLLPDAINMAGQTDVGTLLALIERLDLVLTNDTGPMHIAAAMGTQVIDITLGSAKAHETAPYGEGHILVEPRIGCFSCLPKLRCTHFSCQKLIEPLLVGKLISSSLLGQEFELPTTEATENVNIYRTEFDEDGFLRLRSLNRRPLGLNDLLNEAFREMWKLTIGSASLALSTQERIQRLAVNIQDNYQIHAVLPEITVLCDEMRKLGWVARMGMEAAQRVRVIASNQRKTGEVKRLGRVLADVDEGVMKLAYARPELMPLAAQFIYAKENLESAGLSELAGNTAAIYSDLSDWCAFLPDMVERVIARLTDRAVEDADAA